MCHSQNNTHNFQTVKSNVCRLVAVIGTSRVPPRLLFVDNPVKGVRVCTILLRYVQRAMLILLLVSPLPFLHGKERKHGPARSPFIRPLSFHYFNCFRSDLFFLLLLFIRFVFLRERCFAPPNSSVDFVFNRKSQFVFVHTDAPCALANHQRIWLFV